MRSTSPFNLRSLDAHDGAGRVLFGAGPVVVKLGGLAVDDPTRCPALWPALRELHDAHPAGLVVVHGGAVAVDRMLDRLGLRSERRDGIRLTPEDQIDPITGVLAGSVNTALVGHLRRVGAPAVGLSLGSGGLCRVARSTRCGFDPGRVGEVIGGDGRLVETLLAQDFLPVLSSIGLDDDGRPLNVNADEAAAGIARIVEASALVLLTDVRGVRGADGGYLPTLDGAAIDRLVGAGTIAGGMIPKVRGALDAARLARVPAIIASWSEPEDLLRLARGERAGTWVLPPSERSPRLDEPELPALAPSVTADADRPMSRAHNALN
ncbi:MAG TPA: acetylglutamate kinase [Phycisphaerales bacterium]|nr:acetylglutamate kinase [Phycisphaerales bacterium]HMP37251.1 acetylglutamate kinase [Phycisphaerales bacterium]